MIYAIEYVPRGFQHVSAVLSKNAELQALLRLCPEEPANLYSDLLEGRDSGH